MFVVTLTYVKPLAEDPFKQPNAADYQVVEFVPTMTSPDAASLKEG